jgi:hypothetical protein
MMRVMMEIAESGETYVTIETDDGAEPMTTGYMSAAEALDAVSEQVLVEESPEDMWEAEAAARVAPPMEDEMMEDMV